MPPKVKTDKNMIIEAAFQIVRECGAEQMNARTIAEKLGCSTQPVLYHFKTVEEIRNEIYQKTEQFLVQFLMEDLLEKKNPIISIETNYIRFGYEEKNLFRFLFQSNHYTGQIPEILREDQLVPLLRILSKQLKCDQEKANQIFQSMFATAHGIASLLANGITEYDEDQNREILNIVLQGALNLKEE